MSWPDSKDMRAAMSGRAAPIDVVTPTRREAALVVPHRGEERDKAPSLFSYTRTDVFAYFLLTVLGFSFWFFVAVPFGSHRETYWWLATVHQHQFAHALSFISSTYRPLHQAATWLA